MDKAEVAAVLDEIAVLLELQGENPFRCNAYARAARALNQLEVNLADVIREGKLDEIPGIGATLRDKITTLATTGRLPFYEELKAKTPPGLLDMLRLPGIGPKKVKALYDSLGIDDLAKLQAACAAGQVAELKGFGPKTQQKILEGIAFLGQAGERVRLDQAWAVADQIVAALRQCRGIDRLEVCGSLRRRKETVKDIDILVSSRRPGPIMEAFVKLPLVKKVLGHGETKASVVVEAVDIEGRHVTMNADLRVVTAAQFPFALNYFTGSKEHNVALRQRAIDYGLKLNEYELAGPKKCVACDDEADIYQALDLDYIPPELREDTGEIAAAAAHRLPRLIDADDLHGVFHCHTNWSDGSATLEQMVQAARSRGFSYLGLGDHSQSLTVANGLSPQRVRQQIAEIDALNARLKGFRVFKGTECDILPDGSLDYDEQTLALFDYVVASVHTHFHQSVEEMTQRIIRAISHPRVTMLGHATGRLLLRRDAYKVDLDAVLQAAARHGTMIEINANPYRLDLDWVHCKRAKALGVTLVINPDAHGPAELDYARRYGIAVARRGWLERKDVLNTQTLAQVTKTLAARAALPRTLGKS
ncbi:MAG: DNA polymerase/3'-5' exonuclease PolX [Gemmataceae bacterium]|nr:DNA polymerase/3'-5' exonuclease PolX [Gemmataceae bacterium]